MTAEQSRELMLRGSEDEIADHLDEAQDRSLHLSHSLWNSKFQMNWRSGQNRITLTIFFALQHPTHAGMWSLHAQSGLVLALPSAVFVQPSPFRRAPRLRFRATLIPPDTKVSNKRFLFSFPGRRGWF